MPPISILLVEDNPGDALLIKAGLKRARIANDVTVAINANDALDVFHRRNGKENAAKVDLALLDINLPGMNGIELLQVVKMDPDLKQTPIIMLTSSDAPRDVQQAYQQHANAYINKPVDFDELIKLISTLIYFKYINLNT